MRWGPALNNPAKDKGQSAAWRLASTETETWVVGLYFRVGSWVIFPRAWARQPQPRVGQCGQWPGHRVLPFMLFAWGLGGGGVWLNECRMPNEPPPSRRCPEQAHQRRTWEMQADGVRGTRARPSGAPKQSAEAMPSSRGDTRTAERARAGGQEGRRAPAGKFAPIRWP
jgi:hypothetical protein